MAYTPPLGSEVDFSQTDDAEYAPSPGYINFPGAGNVITFQGDAELGLSGEGELKIPIALKGDAIFGLEGEGSPNYYPVQNFATELPFKQTDDWYALHPLYIDFPEAKMPCPLEGEATFGLEGTGDLKKPINLKGNAEFGLEGEADLSLHALDPNNLRFNQTHPPVYEVPPALELDFPIPQIKFRGDATFGLEGEGAFKEGVELRSDATFALEGEGELTVPWNEGHATFGLQGEGSLTTWYLTGHATFGLQGEAPYLDVELGLYIGLNGFPVGIAYSETVDAQASSSGLFGVASTPDREIETPWEEGEGVEVCKYQSFDTFEWKDICYECGSEDAYFMRSKCTEIARDGIYPIDRCYEGIEHYVITASDLCWGASYIWHQFRDAQDHDVLYELVDDYGIRTEDPSIYIYDTPFQWSMNFYDPEDPYVVPPSYAVNFNFFDKDWLSPASERIIPIDFYKFDLPHQVGTPLDTGCGRSIYWDGFPNTHEVDWSITVPTDPVVFEDDQTYIVEYARRYVVMNNVLVKRVDTQEEIPVTGFSISMDSYLKEDGYSLYMFREEDFLKIKPGASPVEIELTINGVKFVFAADSWSDTDRFLNCSFSVSGKSLTTYLGEPYVLPTSRLYDAPISVVQIADDLLDLTGWTVTMEGYANEVIPADSFAVNNKTYASALKELADSLGYSMRPDRELQLVEFELLYPVVPSLLPTAQMNYEIDSAAIEEMRHSYDYGVHANGVYVGGVESGVFDLIRLDGSDGSKRLPSFTHQLIQTHQLSQQKGIQLLAESRRTKSSVITMPLHDEIGIVKPNRKIKIADAGRTFYGYIRQVSVTGAWDGKALVINQSVTIERHDEDD